MKSAAPSALGNLLGAWGLPILFIGMAVGGWYYWDYRKEKSEQIRVAQQKAAEVAKSDQLKAEKAKAEQLKLDQARAETAKAEQLKAEKMKAEQAKTEQEMKVAAEQRKARMASLRARLLDCPDVTLFDALVRLAAGDGMRIAVDPDAISALSRFKVGASELLPADPTALSDRLARHGFSLHACPVSEKETNLVSLVTTEPTWAYSVACLRARKGQLAEAIKALEAARSGDADFTRHCMALRELLIDLAARKAQLATLSERMKTSLAEGDSNYRAARMFYRGKDMALKGGNTDGFGFGSAENSTSKTVAYGRFEKAVSQVRSACSVMEDFVQKAAAGNRLVAGRFQSARYAGLYSEADLLVANYLDTFAAVRDLYALIEKSELLGDIATAGYYQQADAVNRCVEAARTFREELGDTPKDLLDTRRAVGDRTRLAAGQTAGFRLDGGASDGVTRDLKMANKAFTADRGNVMARAAAGYYRMQSHVRALRDVLGATAGTERIRTLAREFEDGHKAGLLRAVTDLGGDPRPPFTEEAGNVGSVMGLCVSDADGEPFPLSVKIRPREHKWQGYERNTGAAAGYVTPYRGYWSAWSVTERFVTEIVSKPIIFEDYGAKDEDMCAAAIEVYNWLTSAYASNMVDRAIHVSFQSLWASKGGDSAGVSMAVAAVSTISGKPIRPDVAMTGSFRSDGSVHAVGGVYEKVCGAAAAPAVELVILPRENEDDVAQVPLDKMCRVAVVSAADVQTYVRYATDPTFNRQPLDLLRKAQALLLAGKRNEAEPLLLEVAGACPEVYTARRLLELLAFWKKTGLAATVERGFK